MNLTTEQVSSGVLRFCQSRGEVQRDQEMEHTAKVLQESEEWNVFLAELLGSLGGKTATQQTGALILTCFALGVEVGRGGGP